MLSTINVDWYSIECIEDLKWVKEKPDSKVGKDGKVWKKCWPSL